MRRLILVAAFGVMLSAALSGCHAPAHDTSGTTPPEAQTSPTQTLTPAAPPAKIVVYVINPNATGDKDQLLPREVPLTHPQEPARDAVNALMHAAHSPIAPGTSLRGLSIDGGVATVDFSRSPVNETGGESAQSAALNALALTLGQFPEINSYLIHVRGENVKSFGEFSADGPMEVIRPGSEGEAQGSGQ